MNSQRLNDIRSICKNDVFVFLYTGNKWSKIKWRKKLHLQYHQKVYDNYE